MASTNDKEETKGRRQTDLASAKRWLMRAYGLLVFSLAPIFYALIASLFFAGLDISWRMFRGAFTEDWVWQKLSALALLLFTVRVGVFLFSGLRGLVTPLQDPEVRPRAGILLARNDSPDLFGVVEEVRARVRSPAPDEIWLSGRPDCFAVELRWFAISTHRRLLLVIGLPHLAVLSIAELKSLLAHELAHFGGGDTRFGVFLYRFVKHLEAFLNKRQDRSWRWCDPIYWSCLIWYWVCRRLHAPIARFHELRSDAASAAAYGGELAARTLLKEWQLGFQFDSAVASFEVNNRAGPHGERMDLFTWFSSHWLEYSPEGYSYLEQRLIESEQPSFWDSHPTIERRLEVMRQYGGRKCFEDELAHHLLRDFAAMGSELEAAVLAQIDQPAASHAPSRPLKRVSKQSLQEVHRTRSGV